MKLSVSAYPRSKITICSQACGFQIALGLVYRIPNELALQLLAVHESSELDKV